MFTDLVDFTGITSRLGDDQAMRLPREHNELIRGVLRQTGGREVKHTGDGIMASFDSGSQAIRGATAIQDAFRRRNALHPNEAMHVRIDIGAGKPIEERGDLFGSAVQLAARLCDMVEGGQILVAEVALAPVPDGTPAPVRLGPRPVRGFTAPITVYRIGDAAG
ncbi:MAG: adenylate/guanylate cyclase domain-containing protein [SAR202 cluster bacterium]|nr:adenylate/guanylate cyclase domain-containing protein [SAR202 cluster bacterium]